MDFFGQKRLDHQEKPSNIVEKMAPGIFIAY
jgi:hypothetical protein